VLDRNRSMMQMFHNTMLTSALAIDRTSTPISHVLGGNAVEATGLTVVYGRLPVLRDVDLEIAAGESVAVMGPNGAGKSTLLNCLVGAVRPAAGRVRWFGEASARCNFVRRQIGFLGQETGLYDELTATENLLFAGRMYGVSDVHDRVANLLADGNLRPQAHRPVGQLSQGMRQRVAILRALVHEPRLLVLDEPSANLDAQGREWLERLHARWRSAGRAICFASHDAAQCRALADRIVHLDAGRVVAIERCDCPATQLQGCA
jgi:heme ABC exporter ATP-binding subunit CcmA